MSEREGPIDLRGSALKLAAKLAIAPCLLAAGCLIAGVYGALHNQISYTVSPDYFHAFKFLQFQIPAAFHHRGGAAEVGWRASWWMGQIVGPPLILVALIFRDWKQYVLQCLAAFGVAAGTSLVVGLGALAYAAATYTPDSLPHFWYPADVRDPVAFARAATMHNFSYLGGAVGILTGWLYLVTAKSRNWKIATPPISDEPV